jgi:hypothetical protein
MSYTCKCKCPDFLTHARGVSFSPSAMPSRNPRAVQINATEAEWSKDGDAYRRLVHQGYQPKDVDGCAVLEKHATDPLEITDGKLYPKEELRQIKEATDTLTDAGVL